MLIIDSSEISLLYFVLILMLLTDPAVRPVKLKVKLVVKVKIQKQF